MEKLEELSIFFPFWNEEKNVTSVVERAIPIAKQVARRWEILIIDDGSSDKTLEIAKSLAKKHKHIRVISHIPNRGYGAALKEGFLNAKYKIIVFTDGDNQFDFSQVVSFVDKIKSSDIVIGFRKIRQDHPFRHFLMNLLKVWDLLLFRFYFRDIDCGFKMFRRSAIQAILPLHSEGAMITTEILAKALGLKLKVIQVEVSHFPRKFGDQSGGNLRVIIRAIKESYMIWKDLHYGRT